VRPVVDRISTEKTVITKTARDLGELRASLERWLGARLPPGAEPEISHLEAPEANGMSSLTVLFDAVWTDGERRETRSLVARVAPEAASVPVFPVYDLDLQFRVMREVGAGSAVPVPPLLWSEPDPGPVGAPFFVMGRVEGRVPPDNVPYVFGSWVTEATPEQRRQLQESTVRILADVHAIPVSRFAFLEPPSGTTALRHHVDGQRAYYRWTVASDGRPIPLIERAFAWLEGHWPQDEPPAVLSWGDARIGNVMYRDFEPAAVLDWEMAALAPREVDLAWMIYLHRFFEDLAAAVGMPGVPDLLRREDVVRTYQAASGYSPQDLDFFLVYAVLRHAIVMAQTKRRAIHFGEDELTPDPDDMILHRATLEQVLDGTYVWP